MSIIRGMDKEDVVYTQNGILLTIQQSKVVPFATTWMNLDIVLLNEVKSDTERQILYDTTYLWNLKQ